jgi:hypothetical protein
VSTVSMGGSVCVRGLRMPVVSALCFAQQCLDRANYHSIFNSSAVDRTRIAFYSSHTWGGTHLHLPPTM